eukprot:891007-Pelagomonas_calceolata.AAC.3
MGALDLRLFAPPYAFILHRDIKPGNIMLMANDVVKIGDLGVAKVGRQAWIYCCGSGVMKD